MYSAIFIRGQLLPKKHHLKRNGCQRGIPACKKWCNLSYCKSVWWVHTALLRDKHELYTIIFNTYFDISDVCYLICRSRGVENERMVGGVCCESIRSRKALKRQNQQWGRLLPSRGFSQQDGCGSIACFKSESAVNTSVVKKTVSSWCFNDYCDFIGDHWYADS